MSARETLFAFILVVSALAGLASAAPTSDTPNDPDAKPHAVNQLACGGAGDAKTDSATSGTTANP
ncbi:hypothetical protein PtA15_2A203 [Puccinia triticina]|uniref:Uncharacterized protein n=1 Tax=Puccinia triticina TaxID=208348 RepID=A0ABY7CDF4_9BASI|nr:uncharacterized protein PtA15_2A203 [Puccinia triticina]WAQ81890.1 hypothetical protein PtA15_2A203 [Puccinia triticina]